jgi:hypothetical protein
VQRANRIHVTLEPTSGDSPSTWHKYQRYYVMGLRTLPDVQFRHGGLVDQALDGVYERGWRGASFGWRMAARWNRDRRSVTATHVGRYTVRFPDRAKPLRVAIDAHDMREIRDPLAYDWSDLYFKVSRWPRLSYGPKVRPLICGNGALTNERIARLRGMRDHERSLDLVLIAKLWPSKPTVPTYWNPVEHLVRVFETLATLKIRSHLCALVAPLTTGDPFPAHFLKRLTDVGVTVKSDVSAAELWNATAASQLAFQRPGKHLCVSWRMIDHLAMGACTICDRAPFPEWPVPLRVGHELLDCECGIGEDESLPEKAEYERIASTVMDVLADPERIEACRLASADYFDRHVAPSQIARYLLEVSEQFRG